MAGERPVSEEGRQAAAGAAAERHLVSVGAVHAEDGRQRVVVMTEVPEDVVSEFAMLSEISGALPVTSTMPDLAR